MIGVVRHWHGLLREVAVPHPCRQPRSGWRGSEHLMELWVSLFVAGELDQMAFKGPFQVKRLYDSKGDIDMATASPIGELKDLHW